MQSNTFRGRLSNASQFVASARSVRLSDVSGVLEADWSPLDIATAQTDLVMLGLVIMGDHALFGTPSDQIHFRRNVRHTCVGKQTIDRKRSEQGTTFSSLTSH